MRKMFTKIINGLPTESPCVEFLPIDSGFINYRRFIVEFALKCPKIAVISFANHINAQINDAEFVTEGKLIPEPHVRKFPTIFWISKQKTFHKNFKTRAFVVFGKLSSPT